MKKKPLDRRTQRTHKLLREALVSLLFEKRYDAISVQDILDRAGVGRSTFYAHYYDKEDLLVSNLEWLFEALSQHLTQGQNGEAQLLPSLELFRHVQNHQPLYAALAGTRGADRLFTHAQAALSRVITARLGQTLTGGQAPSVPVPIVSNYLAGAFIVLLWWWLDNKMPHSPEHMDDMFRQLALPGVQQVLGGTRR